MAQKIILDCDPGIDDALAIVFAVGHPGLELCGITTVAGNVSLDLTTSNAQRVCEFVAAPGVPVTPGSPAPLLRPFVDAHEVHGDTGLGGAVLPPPTTRPRDGHAIDYLIETIGASPGEITLVATGPLTNIALAVSREPRLVTQVRDFVIMGGSATRGNVTPAAEFNIATDPEAAAMVFRAGWTVTMVGLDVTLRARATAAVRERMRSLGRLGNELLLPGLEKYGTDPEPPPAGALGGGTEPVSGATDPAVHDVCAMAHVADSALLGTVPARVEVETAGRWTSGMTVTDFRVPAGERNALVATAIDADGFWDLVLDSYGRVAAAMG